MYLFHMVQSVAFWRHCRLLRFSHVKQQFSLQICTLFTYNFSKVISATRSCQACVDVLTPSHQVAANCALPPQNTLVQRYGFFPECLNKSEILSCFLSLLHNHFYTLSLPKWLQHILILVSSLRVGMNLFISWVQICKFCPYFLKNLVQA